MRNKLPLLFLITILSILPKPGSGQEFKCITSENGLTSNNVQSIAQDSMGLIWIGTEKGLNSYNGYDIKAYLHNPGDSNSIPDNLIKKILVSQDDQLLIGTLKGLAVYNKNLDNFSTYLNQHMASDPNMQNYINDIRQDLAGNIWIATADGLFRFDINQKKFHSYFNYSILFILDKKKIENLLSKGVPEDIIIKIKTLDRSFFLDMEDLSLRLTNILGEIDFKKYRQIIIEELVENNQQTFYASSINALLVSDSTHIWLGLSNGHLIQVNTTNRNYKIAYLNTVKDLESNLVSLNQIDNKLWCSSVGSAQIFDLEKWQMITPKDEFLRSVLKKRHIQVQPADANKIWISSNDGLYLYDVVNGSNKKFESIPFDPNSLSSNLITSIYFDNQGHVWISTYDGGICKIKTAKQFDKFVLKNPQKPTLQDKKVTALIEDKYGNLWAGYYTGGIDVFNTKGEILYSFDPGLQRPGNIGEGTIMSIIRDKEGVLWVISYAKGLQKFIPSSQTFESFDLYNNPSILYHSSSMICDAQNNIWINSLGNGIYKISSNRKDITHFSSKDTSFTPALKNDWVVYFYTTNDNSIIIQTGERLYNFDEAKKSITPLFDDKSTFEYPANLVFEDSKQNLYIGTTTGLFLVKTQGKFIPNFKNSPILENYTIQGILEDQKKKLWVSTDQGLFKLTIDPYTYHKHKKYSLKQYGVGDGLPNNIFVKNSFFQTDDGKMLFGTEKGFTTFYPDSIKENLHKPNIVLTDFKIYTNSITPGPNSFLEKHISQTKEIVLPHNQNFITIKFAAINYINSDANQYAYQLEGVDNNWIYIDNKREANYTNLRPGDYLFKVKAANNDGIWNEDGVSLNITITPPFWKSNLAMFFYIVIFFVILFIFTFVIKYQEKNKAEMRMERLNVEKDNELNKMKLQFFTNISHEFRTPLTLILGPLESLIEAGKGNSDQIQLIYRNTKKLLSLIDQIMDIRKLSSGKMQLKREKCQIADFVGGIVSNFEYQCNSKKINLVYINNVGKLESYVDPAKLETIISNLLSNAIKHTPNNGEIKVSLQYSEDFNIGLPLNPDNVFSIAIEDTGRGIPDSEIENVFERFYQSSQKHEGGSGIGLNLVKELTEMHRGRVVLKSKVDQGSTFIVYLPLVLSEEKWDEIQGTSIEINHLETTTNAEKSNAEIESSINEHHEDEILDQQLTELDSALPLILIAEDNDEVRQYTISELTNHYRVIEAPNGKEALELARLKYPDIIISDIMMPEMDGLEFCKQLKSDEKTSHIPIILLTAYNNENTNVAGYETGAESFLVKPFNPKVLRSRIKNILQSRERLKEKFSNILYSVPSNKSLSAIDEQFLKKAIKLVEENLVEENFSIEYLCKEMGFSRTALYSKIKALTDQSISEFIKLIRLKKSIELFKAGQKSINEVAFLVGFKTHSHFTRCFSEEFDLSPSEYLTKLENENNT